MMKLIVIDSCMREESRTAMILKPVLECLSDKYDIEVLDVNSLSYPPVSPEILRERNSGHVPEDVVATARKIASADRLVIAAPFWDMSFPAALKAFFENVSLFNVTFTDDGHTCSGLCRCRKVLYLTTRGMNIRTGDPVEQGSPYIRALASLWGLGEVITVAAENLDYCTPSEVEGRIRKAVSEALDICRYF